MYIRLYRNKYTLRPFILLIIRKEKKGEAKGDKDNEGPKDSPRD
jgi:hypothetical protein